MINMLQEIQPHWQIIRPYLAIHNEKDYDRAIEQLNQLVDEVGTKEDHPLYEFLDTLGTMIHAYEGVVSEILNGKRELNVRQIRALAKRFHVSPAVFI
jgi:HTH-type transcriptional regulator/antitoxin HigA